VSEINISLIINLKSKINGKNPVRIKKIYKVEYNDFLFENRGTNL